MFLMKNSRKRALIKNFRQEKNGNIYKIDNKLYLTEKGKIYHSIFYFIKFIFNTDDLIISKKK